MHILIFGTGGVGGYFGGRLALAGEKVTFIARGDHLRTMLDHGLKVESTLGNFVIHPINATDNLIEVADPDVILLCVKAWQLPGAAKLILPFLQRDTFIVPLQNGIDAPSQLAEILGREHVLGGLCGIFSHVAGPGQIHHTGGHPWVAFAELDNHLSARAQDLLEVFEHAGVEAEIPADIQLALWQKFLFISAFSGIGAVTRVPVGIFRAQQGTRQMFIDAVQECYAVAIAHGIPLPADSVTNVIDSLDRIQPEAISSLQRDILNARPSELEAQVGTVVRLAQHHKIPTPQFSLIYNSLLPQEKLARGDAS
ncbi:MAG: 2-dehydropantoate 2-reductase [Anaerolineales bacterium]|nr:2-dehydropantoate 2-reductase [Anaerolineae bacterium]PWB50299.1 MAG: 2-dehydropantoate 2-reductase [Anaerolineales bacterium]